MVDGEDVAIIRLARVAQHLEEPFGGLEFLRVLRELKRAALAQFAALRAEFLPGAPSPFGAVTFERHCHGFPNLDQRIARQGIHGLQAAVVKQRQPGELRHGKALIFPRNKKRGEDLTGEQNQDEPRDPKAPAAAGGGCSGGRLGIFHTAESVGEARRWMGLASSRRDVLRIARRFNAGNKAERPQVPKGRLNGPQARRRTFGTGSFCQCRQR